MAFKRDECEYAGKQIVRSVSQTISKSKSYDYNKHESFCKPRWKTRLCWPMTGRNETYNKLDFQTHYKQEKLSAHSAFE